MMMVGGVEGRMMVEDAGGGGAQWGGRGFHGGSYSVVGISQTGDRKALAHLHSAVQCDDALHRRHHINMDASSQDRENAEASAPLSPLQDGESPHCQLGVAPSCWRLYFKPIMAISVGVPLFGSGTALSLLYFTQVGNVPYLLGPLFLSGGLMFLVTSLVWISILKQSQ